MKKIFIAVLAALLTVSVCAAAQIHKTVYRGAEWHFDVEEREYPQITVIPKDQKEPKVYGNGYVGRAEPEQKKYEIIMLGE